MSRHSPKEIQRIKRIAASADFGKPIAQGSLAAPAGSASVLELGHAKSNDAHCLACGFQMVGGRHVGLCPKCGSDRWYRTRLTPNDQAHLQPPNGNGGAQNK